MMNHYEILYAYEANIQTRNIFATQALALFSLFSPPPYFYFTAFASLYANVDVKSTKMCLIFVVSERGKAPGRLAR